MNMLFYVVDDPLILFLVGIFIANLFPVAAVFAIYIKHLSNKIKSSI